MKLDAHPLVVAVALGMLGPVALAEDDGEDTELFSASDEEDAHLRTSGWEPGPAPSAEEFHRVELEWLKQG